MPTGSPTLEPCSNEFDDVYACLMSGCGCDELIGAVETASPTSVPTTAPSSVPTGSPTLEPCSDDFDDLYACLASGCSRERCEEVMGVVHTASPTSAPTVDRADDRHAGPVRAVVTLVIAPHLTDG